MTRPAKPTTSRVAAGVPTGGQFAASARTEADVVLDEPPVGRFFHATTARLNPGDDLVPGAEIGKRNFGTDFGEHGGGNEHVYLTADPLNAFDWGVQAAKGRKKSVRVYEVEAAATATTRDDEFTATRARIIRDVTNGPS